MVYLVEFYSKVSEKLSSTSNIVIYTFIAYSYKFSICHQVALDDPIVKIKQRASTTTTIVVLW